jgi:hypothetical protein
VPGVVREARSTGSPTRPLGGPPRPENGFDALRVYRVHMTQRGWLGLELRIEGTGRAGQTTPTSTWSCATCAAR